MQRCIQGLLEGNYGGISTSHAPESLHDVETVSDQINEYLNDKIPGNDKRILVHLDDHFKISGNQDFRRGAVCSNRNMRIRNVSTGRTFPKYDWSVFGQSCMDVDRRSHNRMQVSKCANEIISSIHNRLVIYTLQQLKQPLSSYSRA